MELHLAKNVSNSLILLFMSLYKDIEIFFSSVHFLCRMIFSTIHGWRIFKQNPCKIQTLEGQRVSIAEMNVMMNRLGLEDINGSSSFGENDLVSLFEEEEPSLDEIKETFKLFDVNNDGFIDASDLHRVVCSLGLKERHDLEDCEKMIQTFDENGGGLIDFQVFVKFMEKCLC